MTTKNFNVKNGLTTGNITLDGLTGNIAATNANLGNLTISNYFSGNGSLLTGIAGGNVTGQVSNALIAGTVYTNAQPNITSVGTLSSLTVTGVITATAGGVKVGNLADPGGTNTISLASGNVGITGHLTVGTGGSGNVTASNANLGNAVTANYFIGNGSLLTGLPAGYANTDVANYLPTFTGNLKAGNANLGNLTESNYFSGNGSLLSSITGGNVTGQVANALVAGTVYTNAQPNITSVGTLTDVSVSGNAVIGGNLTVSGTTTYVNSTITKVVDPMIELGGGANGASLSTNDNKDRGTLLHYYTTGTVDAFMGWKNSAGEFIVASNATVSNDIVTVNTYGNLHAGYIIANGSALTSLTAGNIVGQVANALVAGTVYTNAQPNITSVGTLTSLSVTGNISGGNINSAGVINSVGNITAPYFIGNIVGNISGTLSVPGNNTAVLFNDAGAAGASDALKFDKAANTLTLTGDFSSLNANLGNAATSNYFIGDGHLLSNIAGGNVTGQVGNALVAGTVYTNAQPNITSVGTLANLTVTGNIVAGNLTTSGSGGNISGADYVIANYFSGSGANLTGLNASNIASGTIPSSILGNSSVYIGNTSVALNRSTGSLSLTGVSIDGSAGTVTTNAQPNITSVGTLSNVAVTGNATVGNLVVDNGILSNRANVTVTTNTVIDEFAPSTFRTAKYVISASGTNGYQSVETLLVHDGSSSYITIYGSLCSNAVADIIDVSSNINGVSGNVTLYATASGSSTKVNVVATYLNT